jgi:hypothetical protein
VLRVLGGGGGRHAGDVCGDAAASSPVSEEVVVREPGRPPTTMKKPWLASVLVLRGRGRRFARVEGMHAAGEMVFL